MRTAKKGAQQMAQARDLVHIFAEYVLVTLRQIPLTEEGIYRFTMSLGHHEPFEIDVPVLRVSQPAYAEIH